LIVADTHIPFTVWHMHLRLEWFKLNKSELYREVENHIVSYLNRCLVFIRSESLYVRKVLSHDSMETEQFHIHSKSKLADIIESVSWAFSIWRQSPSKATKEELTGNPYRGRVAPHEFSSLEGAMPFLDLPDRQLSDAELAQLQSILAHIRDSLCSGSDDDYNVVLDWMPYVCQHPDRKIEVS